MTEPIDQATKELIEKEAQVAADCEYDVDYPYEKYYVKGYIAGATNSFKYLEKLLNEKLYKEVESLREQLKQKEEQNAKLKEALSQLIEILEDVKYVGFNNLPAHLYNEYKALADSAKKLLTEEPLNQSHHDKEHKGQ